MHELLKKDISSVKSFAPATTANVAVGFDILGFPISGVGDTVRLRKRDDDKIIIENVIAPQSLPTDIDQNTATIALRSMCDNLGIKQGFSVDIEKGIPMSSGMGGSAASAVAAVVALNTFLTQPLTMQQLASHALMGEAHTGGLADNVIPCLYGGLILTRSIEPIDIIPLPIPDLHCVLVHPHLEVNTLDARKLLTAELPLKAVTQQSANLASFIVALYENDFQLLQTCLQDILIEPQRAPLVAGFYDVKRAANQCDALGVSLSGSGPSLFAWFTSIEKAKKAGTDMQDAFKQHNIDSDIWISPINQQGAYITNINEKH